MIEKNEVLLKVNNEWKHYSNPHCIISATNIEDVKAALEKVETFVNKNNWHAAGFISYEAAPAFDSALSTGNSAEFPLLWFGLYSNPKAIDLPLSENKAIPLSWQATTSQADYNWAIEKIKERIAQGNTYQVNYTMRLNSNFNDDAWDLFLNLAQNQNKYAAYINTGQNIICSASPELFFKLDGDKIYSRPMKGTAKRGRNNFEDKTQSDWLHLSLKNRAENVMIVDMVRNDLGRIAETGSVQVPELFKVEKYTTLFQMTSLVQAKTQASITEIFSALFPCASITGAPKVSTMKIIAELEATPRKIYTGSIGTFAPNRKAQFNVAIRTVLINQYAKTAEYGIGGGITWDSTSADEYDEALLKARVLTERHRDFLLLETLLWTPQEGYFLLEKHLKRISDSAQYFDIPFSRPLLMDLLDKIQEEFSSPQRVRITLDFANNFRAEMKDYLEQGNSLKVKLANEPINSSDLFYFHKTTRREIYPKLEGFDDILLYNERGELTEFTIGNLVVELNGELITPPISCGLLAGTFRAHLLETNAVREQVIHKDDIKNCTKVFFINSVRKWMEVQI